VPFHWVFRSIHNRINSFPNIIKEEMDIASDFRTLIK
ncbi:unnamed protein product, partial [marine sediment metagenome]